MVAAINLHVILSTKQMNSIMRKNMSKLAIQPSFRIVGKKNKHLISLYSNFSNQTNEPHHEKHKPSNWVLKPLRKLLVVRLILVDQKVNMRENRKCFREEWRKWHSILHFYYELAKLYLSSTGIRC